MHLGFINDGVDICHLVALYLQLCGTRKTVEINFDDDGDIVKRQSIGLKPQAHVILSRYSYLSLAVNSLDFNV